MAIKVSRSIQTKNVPLPMSRLTNYDNFSGGGTIFSSNFLDTSRGTVGKLLMKNLNNSIKVSKKLSEKHLTIALQWSSSLYNWSSGALGNAVLQFYLAYWNCYKKPNKNLYKILRFFAIVIVIFAKKKF